VLLVSGFSSLPRLLESYSFKGITPPMLAPLRAYPFLQNWFRSKIVDTWNTASRLAHIVQRSLAQTGADITVLHARDDREIPWREGRAMFDAAASGVDQERNKVVKSIGNETEVLEVDGGKVRLGWQQVKYGGHNRVVTFQVVARELLRVFERAGV
jgi:hypothetical protein